MQIVLLLESLPADVMQLLVYEDNLLVRQHKAGL